MSFVGGDTLWDKPSEESDLGPRHICVLPWLDYHIQRPESKFDWKERESEGVTAASLHVLHPRGAGVCPGDTWWGDKREREREKKKHVSIQNGNDHYSLLSREQERIRNCEQAKAHTWWTDRPPAPTSARFPLCGNNRKCISSPKRNSSSCCFLLVVVCVCDSRVASGWKNNKKK